MIGYLKRLSLLVIVNSVRVDEWTAERVIIASNVKFNNEIL